MTNNLQNAPSKDEVVYVVDDDEAMRDSLAWLLQSNDHKVSCHESGERFLQALSSTESSTVACALIDIKMPGMSGIDLHRTLLNNGYTFPIAFITGHGVINQAVQAIRNGAIDFLQKPFKEEVLLDLVKKMFSMATQQNQQVSELSEISLKIKSLTPREEDVLEKISQGKTNKEIGFELEISVKTVEAHRANIMDKLCAKRPANLLQQTIKYQEAKAKGLI